MLQREYHQSDTGGHCSEKDKNFQLTLLHIIGLVKFHETMMALDISIDYSR